MRTSVYEENINNKNNKWNFVVFIEGRHPHSVAQPLITKNETNYFNTNVFVIILINITVQPARKQRSIFLKSLTRVAFARFKLENNVLEATAVPFFAHSHEKFSELYHSRIWYVNLPTYVNHWDLWRISISLIKYRFVLWNEDCKMSFKPLWVLVILLDNVDFFGKVHSYIWTIHGLMGLRSFLRRNFPPCISWMLVLNLFAFMRVSRKKARL